MPPYFPLNVKTQSGTTRWKMSPEKEKHNNELNVGETKTTDEKKISKMMGKAKKRKKRRSRCVLKRAVPCGWGV